LIKLQCLLYEQFMTKPPLISLLQAASEGRRNLRLADLDEAAIHWAVQTGFGPLLFQTAKHHHESLTSSLWPLLHGAYLTARVVAGEQFDGMNEIIDACRGRVSTLVLLKGISICDQHYPKPYLRPMRDLDFLVEVRECAAVESLLLGLGYRRQSELSREFYQSHHHTMPFFHPRRGLYVEVHRALFPQAGILGSDKLFTLQNLAAQLRPALFQGRKVIRLSDEFQLIYIASHWASQISAVGMIAMLDVIYLLRSIAARLDWDLVLHWLRGSVAATHLYLLLTYLTGYRLIKVAPEVLRELFSLQRSFGHLNLKILHALIDRIVVAGKGFGGQRTLRNLGIVWSALISHGRPFHNLSRAAWNLLPSRWRLLLGTRVKSPAELPAM
jgi:Uncharacterised nucleotidyltransferase